MVNQNRVVAWKWLKDQLKLIGDPILRNALFAELKKRAWEEWGYNPETAYVKKQNTTVELDDWEKDFVEDNFGIGCYPGGIHCALYPLGCYFERGGKRNAEVVPHLPYDQRGMRIFPFVFLENQRL